VTSNNYFAADILMETGQLRADEAEAALLEATGRKADLLDVLAETGRDKRELFLVLAGHCGFEAVDLPPGSPPAEAARLMPAEVAVRYRVVPLRKEEGVLTVAIGDPFDIETLDTLRYVLKDPVEVLAALPDQVATALARLYPGSGTLFESMLSGLEEGAPGFVPEAGAPDGEPAESDEPIIRLVNLLILEGFRQRASDIHLEPLARQFRVRYRIDGVLREVEGPPRRLHPPVVSRIKIMAGMRISEKRLPQDGRIEVRAMGRDLDLRVSSIPSNHGESVVMRILDKQSLAPGLANLGLDPGNQAGFGRLIRHPDGIVLITGPTGSGKTTTLYACLNHLNTPDRKIITVEDPVEYQLAGINQVPVHAAIGLTFAAALRSMLRQAPNIIMVGEIRDRETAEIAVQAALTGHLVLSTLHTNDAPSAIPRLADMGVKPFLVASSVRGIMAQRLVRTICEGCKKAVAPTAAETRVLGPVPRLYRGEGCPACGKTGYFGRKGIFELLAVNDEVRQMIHAGATAAAMRAAARALGMRTLREDGLRKVADGLTTLNEVLRITMDEEAP